MTGVKTGRLPPGGQGAGESLRPKLLLAKDGLLRVDCEAVLTQAAKHFMKMLSMNGVVRARNQYVVKIDKDKSARTRSIN